MMPYAALAAIIVAVAAFVGGYWRGESSKDTEWRAKSYQELAEANEAARKQQTMWHGVVNETVKKTATEKRRIRNRLDTALDQLRQRPERLTDLSDAPRAHCAGGTGAELSRTDAEFLSREAARANEIRAGLIECYAVMDATQ